MKPAERLLGRYTSGREGPTVVVCGGLHGNEPSGILAAQRVLARLGEDTLPLRGEFVALAGNLGALAQDRRFLQSDLNRTWTRDRIAELRRDPDAGNVEEREMWSLLELIEATAERATTPLVVLDLHTTSGQSPPFVLISDRLPNRPIAFALPGPVILGLEETVDGTLLEFLTEEGHRAIVIEGGQHADPASVDNHEAAIWLGLAAAGALDIADVPDHDQMRRRLREATKGLPRVVELRHRHAIAEQNGFVMEPGFVGFQPVRQGDLLARHAAGEIRAPESGRILMPLYQEQGSEGFYLVRRVSRLWLILSAALRRLHLHVLLPLMPGVRQDPDNHNALRVNPAVARWFVVEIFHLFGYRRRRPDGERLVFSRRRPL